MINRTMYECVYNKIKSFLSTHNEFAPVVLKQPKGDKFPRVVVEMISNDVLSRDIGMHNVFSSVGIEINIYAKNMTSGKVKYADMQVAEKIADDISFVCEDLFEMKRTLYSPTPNIDADVYRLTLRYSALQDDKRNRFI